MQTTLYLPQKNKMFHMLLDASSNVIKITFGEIGKCQITKQRPAAEWDNIIKEKKKNGYTEVFLEGNVKKNITKVVNSPENDVIQFLSSISRQIVNKNYKLLPEYLSETNIKRAKNKLIELSEIKELREFNKKLYELFTVIPRKMSYPILYTAKSAQDFESILQREYDLLDNLDCYSINMNPGSAKLTICNEKEKNHILSMFDRVTASKVTAVYSVLDNNQEEKFKKYSSENHITNHKLLFHGSRNENWWSIICNGLKINPVNVIISGKMFGNGIYFADNADKSAGYTSIHGSRHAGGNSAKAFMGIYNVALGKSWNIDKWKEEYIRINKKTIETTGYNSVHAHKGSNLVHDEMIIYNNDACVLKYLVELTAR